MRLLIALCLLMAVPALAEPSGLLLYAPLDGSGDAAFALGDGRQQGGLLGFNPGLRGQAVSLTSDLLYAVPGNFRSEAGTVALWLRPHWDGAEPVEPPRLLPLRPARPARRRGPSTASTSPAGGGQCNFTIYTREAMKTVGVAAPIAAWKPDEWHHVAVTWCGVNSGKPDAEMRLYLDGALAAKLTGKQIDRRPDQRRHGHRPRSGRLARLRRGRLRRSLHLRPRADGEQRSPRA